MNKNFSQAVAPSGQIYVNDLMQVSAADPKHNPFAPAIKENIFALGDCCLTSIREEKSILALNLMLPYIVKNIIQLASKQRPSNQLPNKLPYMSFVSLGPEYMLQIINGMAKLDPKAGPMKKDFTLKTIAIFKGDQAERNNRIKMFGKITGFLSCVDCMCCCCPCSNCFTKNKRRIVRQ
jgi:hypothetical protein